MFYECVCVCIYVCVCMYMVGMYVHVCTTHKHMGSLCGLMAKVLDCDIVANRFKLQSLYYVHFWTNIQTLRNVGTMGVRKKK